MNDTRERILDAAEDLFAARGISGTSLRALTRAAGVNLAAVHYHFGSKEALLDAVVERRAGAVNAERLRELASLESEGRPGVEAVLRAFLLPGVRTVTGLGPRADLLSRLFARIMAQPTDVLEAVLRRHFGAVNARVLRALERALPHLPEDEVAHRFRLAVGCMNHVFSGNLELDITPGSPVPDESPEVVVERLIAFVAAGLSASAPGASR